MRVLIGLAALAAVNVVNGQTVTPTTNNGNMATAPPIGQAPRAIINCYQTNLGGTACPTTPSGQVNGGAEQATSNWSIYVPNAISQLVFTFQTNIYTAQIQYRWAPGYPNPAVDFPGYSLSAQSFRCDPCAGSSAISCNTATGPGASPSPFLGYACASFTRQYTMSNLLASITTSSPTVNSFSVMLFDINSNPAPNVTSYSFQIVRNPPPVVGDPMIYGIQGQDFQVHGIPDEIFNLITYPTLQVNARFVYLSAAECIDNFTQCFAHPGTYISEEGIRLGADKIHVKAGSAKKGLTVKVNGQKMTGTRTLKAGEVELVNHRRVVIKSSIAVMAISNSDHFLNQETQLLDSKLLALGATRTKLLVGESFHSEVPLHGLQGQTWRNVEYPTGLEYEGSISDYHVTDGNLFGSAFVFNKFQN